VPFLASVFLKVWKPSTASISEIYDGAVQRLLLIPHLESRELLVSNQTVDRELIDVKIFRHLHEGQKLFGHGYIHPPRKNASAIGVLLGFSWFMFAPWSILVHAGFLPERKG
jgi:hypothetical protein